MPPPTRTPVFDRESGNATREWLAYWASVGQGSQSLSVADVEVLLAFAGGGEPGPAGATGATGATGPAGPAGDTPNFAAEAPSGTINGVNVTFTLANTPSDDNSVMLFLNGLLQRPGDEYTISGATITMGIAPSTGDNLFAYYRF